MAVKTLRTTVENLEEVLGAILARPSNTPAGNYRIIDLERWVDGTREVTFEYPDSKETVIKNRIVNLRRVGALL